MRALALALLALAGCAPVLEARSSALPADATDVGFQRLMFDDFHGLSTETLSRSAVPWKVLATALLLEARTREPGLPLSEASAVRLLSQRYGFLVPHRIANWPGPGQEPRLRRPLGLIAGTLENRWPRLELEVTNTGCSTCHAGTTYDVEGNPTLEAWIGLPSTSINLGRYADEVFTAFRSASRAPERLLTAIPVVFPGVTPVELETIRRRYLPELARRMPTLERIGGFTPYSNGSPGLTNGVATMKMYLGVLPMDRRADGEVAFVGVPDFGALRWKTAILVDGVYAPTSWPHSGPLERPLAGDALTAMAGVATVVTVGTLGVDFRVAAAKNVPRVREVLRYLVSRYQPPRFPGPVDEARARAGADVYACHCEGCHGRYARSADGAFGLVEFPNRVVATEVIGTDPARAQAVAEGVNEAFRETAMGALLEAKANRGYVGTPLSAVWATAPYLHNGSVPTLWHLMHPEARPARFQVGGHKLDWRRLGLAGEVASDGVFRYPESYTPWMLPEVYDTSLPGRHNGGHVEPFAHMLEAERAAVLEFMKLL